MTKLKLDVLLNGIDKLTSPIKKALSSNKELARTVKATRDQLKTLQRQQENITGFKKQSAALHDAQQKLNAAQEKVRAMREQLRAGGADGDKFSKAFKKANEQVRDLTVEVNKQRTHLGTYRQKLAEAGIKTSQLAADEARLKTSITDTTQALNQQQAALDKVNKRQAALIAAKARYSQRLEIRDKLAGAGAASSALGTATGLPIVKMIRDYSSFEDAMLGVARQVDGARDDNGRLTQTYYDMGKAIKAMSQTLPMATTQIAALVEGGARMGIKGKDNLIAFTQTAALAATAFDLPADQISEDLGKIANIYKIPIKDMQQLGDVINYLDDNAQSKGADIINVMQRIAGSTGSMDFKQAAALGSTFLSLGASAEIAATASKAMVRELQIATKQPPRFQKGLKELGLNAKQIQADMAKDSTSTILKVLEAVNRLPKTHQMGVMVDLFGKEYGDDAAKLAENLGEYRKQLALVKEAKAKGSMQREGDAKNDTLSARLQMLQNRLFNTSSGMGQAMRQPLTELIDDLSKALDKIERWTQANPKLTATLIKIAVIAATLLILFGGLALGIAGILGPLAMASLAFNVLGISMANATRAAGIVGVLAVLALLLWQYWGPISQRFIGLWEEIKDAFKGGLFGILKLILNWSPIGMFYRTFATVLSWFGIELPAKFTDYGKNLIQSLINGLKSMWGALTQWVDDWKAKAKQMFSLQSNIEVTAQQKLIPATPLPVALTQPNTPLLPAQNVKNNMTEAGAMLSFGPGSGAAPFLPPQPQMLMTNKRAPQQPTTIPLTINVHPSQGMNEKDLAQQVATELQKHQRQQAARQRAQLRDDD